MLYTRSLGFTTVGDSRSYRLVSCPGSSSSCIQTSSTASLYQLYNNYCICLFANLLSNVFPNANECVTRISGTINYAYCVYATSSARNTGRTDFFRISCSVQGLFQNFRGTLGTVPLYLISCLEIRKNHKRSKQASKNNGWQQPCF